MPSLKVERGFPRGAALSCDLKVSRGVGQLRCGWGRRGTIGKQERKEGTVASEGKQPVIGGKLGPVGARKEAAGLQQIAGACAEGAGGMGCGWPAQGPTGQGKDLDSVSGALEH